MAIPEDTEVYGVLLPNKSKNQILDREALVKGFTYPLVKSDTEGYFSKSTGLKLAKNMLKSFIRTNRGERFMLTDYGVNLQKYLMEPLDETTFRLIKEEIETSVRRYLRIFKPSKLQVFETRTGALLIKLFVSLNDVENGGFNIEVRI
jgi:phage baseplate assembly protein W